MRIVSILFTLTILGAVATCTDPKGQVKKGDDIILGGLFNLKGSQEDLDIPTFRGARLAVDEINASGGVLGKKVLLVSDDGKSRPKKVEKSTEKILEQYPGVSAFLGLSDTDMVLAAAPAAAAGGRLFLTSGATSPKLPSEVPQYLYLACFGDNVQAAAAAEFAYHSLEGRSASILYDSTDTYTNLLQGYFRKRFEQLGGTIASSEPYSPGELSGPVSRLQPANIVFLSAHVPDDAVEAVRLLRDAGFSVPILGGDGFDAEDTWLGQTAVHDVYFTTHVYLGSDTTDWQVSAFRAAYEAAYVDHATAFAALGYDAVKLIADAIRRAGSAEPEDVLDGLRRTRGFDGVTGTISFEDGTRIPTKSVAIIRIDGSAYRLADEWTPSQTPAP